MNITAEDHIKRMAKRDDDDKPSCLLHTCCAPCSTSVFEQLLPNHKVTGFYYNPNIHPISEFNIRKEELILYSQEINMPLHIQEGDIAKWFKVIGDPSDFEEARSRHCYDCYTMRLEETAIFARDHGFEYFATVLSVSPHKVAEWLNEIGKNLETQYGVKWIEANFKKKGGFQRSLDISKSLGMYRQDYCGCVYSLKETAAKRKQKELDKQTALSEMDHEERHKELIRLNIREKDAENELLRYHEKVGILSTSPP